MSARGASEIQVAGPASTVFEPEVLDPLLGKVFPAYLGQKRWFRSKSREIVGVKTSDRLLLPLEASGELTDEKILALALLIVEVHFRTGLEETYHLPLAIRTGDGARSAGLLSKLRFGRRREEAALCDALEDPDCALKLLEALEKGAAWEGVAGKAALEQIRRLEPSPRGNLQVRSMGAEQSNSSVVFGDQVVLKVFRKVEVGVNPELEMGRYLTLKGFHHTPKLYLSLEYLAGRLPAALLLVQEFVPSLSDGWSDALSHVRSFFDDPSPVRMDGELDSYGVLAESLGRTTAELHETLASDTNDPAFSPERVEAADAALWANGLLQRLDRLARTLDHRTRSICELRPKIEKAVHCLKRVKDLGKKIRHHGDYHLGQVLRTRDGWVLLDFEGEPACPLEERRAKQSPLRDVAGMLRSFSYAAHAALFERCSPESSEWARLEPRAMAWESRAREAFLRGYLLRMGDSPILPAAGSDQREMLAFFELEKAIYELGYELDNRPDWARIPLKGIERLVGPGRD
jgi:maltose alpha-D-glucosyltransferase/alpha-amylase